MKRWIVAITGASGSSYGRRLIQVILENFNDIGLDIITSDAALRVIREEEGLKISSGSRTLAALIPELQTTITIDSRFTWHSCEDIGATIASGSVQVEGMVICPCSMNTLAAIAHGISANLIQRAADVTIKEGRHLILVPRETPLSPIHLENMLRLARLGAVIAPAMPGFYHRPGSLAELIDMQVMKILDQMGLQTNLASRWKQQ
ncbi:MAG: UbiX family flavin prenyltransferase [bacterium]|nr:UbiX family flavin prenyltransferase [bacterium]